MAKVIIFSRIFPAYHPKAGQPTFFVEKLYNALQNDFSHKFNEWQGTFEMLQDLNNLSPDLLFDYKQQLSLSISAPKYHTIRAGKRFKAGDKFSPRVWSGKPYQSKQIIIAPDIEVKKVWDYKVGMLGHIFPAAHATTVIQEVADNDGLEIQDFRDWFKNDFDGQIICWSNEVNY